MGGPSLFTVSTALRRSLFGGDALPSGATSPEMRSFSSTFHRPLRVGHAVAVVVGALLARDAHADDVIGTTSDAPSADATALGSGTAAATGAVPSPGRHTYELGGHADYTMAPIRGGTNPFGVGFGARIGFLLSHVYVGGNVVSYLGGTDVDTSETALLLGAELGYDVGMPIGNGWISLRPQVGVGGVQITRTDPSLLTTSSALTTRTAKLGTPDVVTHATPSRPSSPPSGGGGSSTSTASGTGSSGASSAGPSDKITVSNLYLQPGVSAVYSADLFFVGANANVLIVPGLEYGGYQMSWFALGVQGQAGLRW